MPSTSLTGYQRNPRNRNEEHGTKSTATHQKPTVDSQHGCIQIEDRTRSRVSTAQHFLWPPVVECNEFVSPQEAKALQKATERRGCWVTGKSCQVLKDPIAAQRLGGLDPPQAEDKRIQQRLDCFADRVLVVPLSKTNPSLQLASKAKPLEEGMKQGHAAKCR